MTEGYWGPRTASEDWCEPNYVVTPYIAEFWNVLSSIPIVMSGLWMLWNGLRQGYRKRFLVSGILFAMIGIGSIWFHGTLRFEGQALDELSMIFTACCFLYASLEDRPQLKYPWLPYALAAYCLGFSITYAFLPQFFIFFLVSFIAGSTMVVFLGVRLYLVETDNKLKRQYWIGVALWAAAFFLCWLPDKLICAKVQHLNLHSIFHLISATTPMWLMMYVIRCHYQHELVRRTGRMIDARGNLVPAPQELLLPLSGGPLPLPVSLSNAFGNTVRLFRSSSIFSSADLPSPAPAGTGVSPSGSSVATGFSPEDRLLPPSPSVTAHPTVPAGGEPARTGPTGATASSVTVTSSPSDGELRMPFYRYYGYKSFILYPWVELKTKKAAD